MVHLTLSIRCSTGENFKTEVEDEALVEEFKAQLEEHSKIPRSEQRIIFKGHVMKDNSPLSQYGIGDGDVIHLVRIQGSRSQSAPVVGASTTVQGNSTQNTLGGLGGMPGMEMFQQNPGLMQSMMNSPMMQGLLDNPELIRQMMLSNPQMRTLMENNPHLNHVLNDPELLRQGMNAAMNPAVLQEMMRNQDRAMANIESLPGGYNALMRMYQDVHEPMMEAAEQANVRTPGSSQQGASPQPNSDPRPQNSPMPNPWGGSSSSGNSPSQQTSSQGLSGLSFPMFQTQGQSASSSTSGMEPWMLFNPFTLPSEGLSSHQASSPWGSPNDSGAKLHPTNSAGPRMDGPNPWAPASSADSPEVKYKDQLSQIESMGFPDKTANIQALLRNNGNVNSAIESLIEDLSKKK